MIYPSHACQNPLHNTTILKSYESDRKQNEAEAVVEENIGKVLTKLYSLWPVIISQVIVTNSYIYLIMNHSFS